jgi:hypothetical protein
MGGVSASFPRPFSEMNAARHSSVKVSHSLSTLVRHGPRKRAIQYPAPSQDKRASLSLALRGVLDRPAKPGDDEGRGRGHATTSP